MNSSRRSSFARAVVALSLATVMGATAACGGREGADERPARGEEAELIDWIATHPDQASLLASGGGDSAGELEWKTEVDPDAGIGPAELELWYLAGTDGGAHERALTALSVDAAGQLSLDDMARAMIEFSDNAATDYLLARLGRERILETARLLGVEALGSGVSPITGALLALAKGEPGASAVERLERLSSLSVEARSSLAWRLAAGYEDAPEQAVAGLAPALQGLTDWQDQLALADALPWRGSARDLASLVREARSGNLLGSEAAELMARHLSWPMADPANSARFETLGAKDGEVAGVLALAGFARPRSGAWKGEDRVVVLLVEGMDPAAWEASREMYYQLVADLADRPDVVTRAREILPR